MQSSSLELAAGFTQGSGLEEQGLEKMLWLPTVLFAFLEAILGEKVKPGH